MNPFKWFKNQLQKSREKETKEFENQKIELTKRLDQLTNEMLASKCAINNFKNCSIECIHFNPGSVFLISGIGYASKEPSCKLWR
ncbi:hypothetical protein HN385_06195 [archaeon]|jgi:hypothetical protein|nr:hypothetical protein [archaeon]